MAIRKVPKWCRVCQDYVPNIADHIRQHNLGENSDARDRQQYIGSTIKKKEDYFVCVLHQKKVPCSSRKFDGSRCDSKIFGMIKKSFMMNCIKGMSINPAEYHYGRITEPYFPVSDDNNCWYGIPINMDDKTVVIKGVLIHLKF